MLIKPNKYVEIWDTDFRWDDKIKRLKTTGDGKNLEKIASPFAEDFRFFVRKNDYYFVTESGKLFHSPPPMKGEETRAMKALWQGDNYPITAIIEDADNDKVWLFTKSHRKSDTQGNFFEMADQIVLQKFDYAKLAPVNVEGRAKMLLEFLPLISAEKKK